MIFNIGVRLPHVVNGVMCIHVHTRNLNLEITSINTLVSPFVKRHAMLFKGNDLALQNLSIVVIASFVFVMVLLRPQINEYILPLRLWKDGHSSTTQPVPYNPYPDYNSAAWKRKWRGSYQSCVGPDGALLDPKNEGTAMKGYRWNQSGLCLEQDHYKVFRAPTRLIIRRIPYSHLWFV